MASSKRNAAGHQGIISGTEAIELHGKRKGVCICATSLFYFGDGMQMDFVTWQCKPNDKHKTLCPRLARFTTGLLSSYLPVSPTDVQSGFPGAWSRHCGMLVAHYSSNWATPALPSNCTEQLGVQLATWNTSVPFKKEWFFFQQRRTLHCPVPKFDERFPIRNVVKKWHPFVAETYLRHDVNVYKIGTLPRVIHSVQVQTQSQHPGRIGTTTEGQIFQGWPPPSLDVSVS